MKNFEKIEKRLFDHFLDEFLKEYRGRTKEHNVKSIQISQFIKKHKLFSFGKNDGVSFLTLERFSLRPFHGKGLYSFIFHNQFQFHIYEFASLGENVLLVKKYHCEQKENGTWKMETEPFATYFQPSHENFSDIKLYKHKEEALMEGAKQLKKRLKIRDSLHERQMNELHTLIQAKLNEWDIHPDEQYTLALEEKVRKQLKTFVSKSLQYVVT
jgi:hypothetical protein